MSTGSDEYLDALDDLGRPLGVLPRAEVHHRGHWHRVFHCLVLSGRAGGSAVLQRRAATKAAFAGCYDLSATGHLAAGETTLDGVRELAEELGIELDPSALVPLGERRLVDDGGEGRWNRELVSVHLARDDRPLAAYRPDPAEVSAIVDVPVDAALALLAGEIDTVAVAGIGTGGEALAVDLGVGDLVPGTDYWITLLVMARRFLDGDRPLAI